MTLRSWVCFDTWFFRFRCGVRQTQPTRLLDAAEFPDTRSSPVEASKHPKLISNKSFNEPVFLNLAPKMDYKWPILVHF